MFDTVHFRLTQQAAGQVDLLSEIPCYLENVGEHSFESGCSISGSLNGLKVTISKRQVKIQNSLCKYYLGNNLETITRADAQRAIERLSDELHLPIQKADIARLDVAQNFIMQHQPAVYFNHLGAAGRYQRLEEPDGLCYRLNNGNALCFYDKLKEAKQSGCPIPELFIGKNVLRYEQRYQCRLLQKFGRQVKADLLYNEEFYINLLNNWKQSYQQIHKINNTTMNFENIKGKKDLSQFGIITAIEHFGGANAVFSQIKEAQQRGQISKKQASDLRKAINDANQKTSVFAVQNDVVSELDRKVAAAVKFYR